MQLQNLTLKTLLRSGFLMMALVTLIIGATALVAINGLGTSARNFAEQLAPQSRLIADSMQLSARAYSEMVLSMSGFEIESREDPWTLMQRAEDDIVRLQQDYLTASSLNLDGLLTQLREFKTLAQQQLSALAVTADKRKQESAAYNTAFNELAAELDEVRLRAQDDLRDNAVEGVDTAKSLLAAATLQLEQTLAGDMSSEFSSIREQISEAQDAVSTMEFAVLSAGGLATAMDSLGQIAERRYQLGQQHKQFLDAALVTLQTRQSKLIEDSDAINQSIQQQMSAGQASLDSSITTSLTSTTAVMAIGTVLALVLTSVILRLVTGPLNQCISVASSIARGDLRVQIEHGGKSETGQLLTCMRNMTEHLQQMVSQLKQTSHSLLSGNRNLSHASRTMSEGATEQAENLRSIRAAIDENASTIRSTAGNARDAAEMAQMVKDKAHTGNEWMDRMLAAMGDINQSAEQIAQIISTIDEIAFQTNLLALNASVEAARAGEHGKGFAVVAAEVRNLAQRSAQAASETKALIEQSIQRARSGEDIAGNTAQSLAAIAESIGKVDTYIKDIARASEEQSHAVDEIKHGIAELNSITERNTQIAEQSASSSESLLQLTGDLEGLIQQFQVADNPSQESSATAFSRHNPDRLPQPTSLDDDSEWIAVR